MKIEWKGEPGHFIGCWRCCFRLHTVIGERIRVSTVGCYHPRSAGEPSEDNIEPLDAAGHTYETMVFSLSHGDANGLEAVGYMTAREAEEGHRRMIDKWADIASKPLHLYDIEREAREEFA